MKSYDRTNFHKNTFCIFKEVEISAAANLKPNHKSKSGSEYYFTDTGVYRLSNHWGRAAKCKWRLQQFLNTTSRIRLGYAAWTAFHEDNDIEKLYFITSDGDGVAFNHKDNGNHSTELLRTASETTNRIRQIRNLISNDAWTKYFILQNIEEVKSQIIHQLIDTDKPLQIIKTEVRENL